MWRIITVIASGLIISACGGGISTYLEGMEAYDEIVKEMVSVLEGVTDEASAKKAAGEIEGLGNRLAEISTQVADLPQPNAEEMQEIVKKRDEMQALQKTAEVQLMKLEEYAVLQDAWTRAMENMQ